MFLQGGGLVESLAGSKTCRNITEEPSLSCGGGSGS
jgi:hypothetical protein